MDGQIKFSRRNKINIVSYYQTHAHIYIEASKAENRVRAAILHGDALIQLKHSNKCSIYTAEAQAILNGLKL